MLKLIPVLLIGSLVAAMPATAQVIAPPNADPMRPSTPLDPAVPRPEPKSEGKTDGGGGDPKAPAAAPEAAKKEPPLSRAAELDKLFEGLKAAKSEEEAKPFEERIARLMLRSGSDTVDLLMSWAAQASGEKNEALAFDILDRIVLIKPDYAEGWNKRATLHFSNKEFGKALADLEKVLAIEPRHFGAMAGLGAILREIGFKADAAKMFKRALEVDPYLDSVKKALQELELEVGRDA